jgi:YD repeat-containing protein
MNCRGCGVELDPSQEQVNEAVDQVLETSLQDAHKTGGVCPLCGHSKDVPYSHRKSVLFTLLVASLVASVAVGIAIWQSRLTQRALAARDAVARMSANQDVAGMLGSPITMEPGVKGDWRQDETGWKEVRLTIPVRGPKAAAVAHVVGGRGTGPWVFTTFEVDFEQQHKKVDLVSGRVLEYDPNTYVDIHTEPVRVPEYTNTVAALPKIDGQFPCVFATVNGSKVLPEVGRCATPTTHGEPVDHFEADLRYATFILRETDLYLDDVFQVPLTRSYTSNDWLPNNPVHAFGRNSNHPYDIAPLGTRNPYTYQLIALEDGEFLYFDRISKGTGYADAMFQHTETSTPFYKATTQWDGHGWTTKLADGSEILFPESYNAKNLAQGAPYEMRDAQGNRLELRRDGQRNLQEIRTPNGHWIRFSYDDQARVKRAEDDAGHWAQYEYNDGGLLQSVALSSGRGRHYEYNGVLMTRVTDEKGGQLVRNSYAGRFLTQQQFGSGAIYSYRYDWPQKEYCARKVWVNLPDSMTQELAVGNSVPDYVRNADQYKK